VYFDKDINTVPGGVAQQGVAAKAAMRLFAVGKADCPARPAGAIAIRRRPPRWGRADATIRWRPAPTGNVRA